MRILFVRHGEPDYKNDCLTETGLLQAKACAERLMSEGISEIYSSPQGRARQTAQETADRLGLPVNVLDFMHEVTWGGDGVPEKGHPWTLSSKLLYEENFDFSASDWKKHPYFEKNIFLPDNERVSREFDRFLEKHGFIHEGGRFRCGETATDKTIALFSHGGSGGVVISSLLNLPFPYVAAVMPYGFTSIISISIPAAPGYYVHPFLQLFNDMAHTQNAEIRLQKDAD